MADRRVLLLIAINLTSAVLLAFTLFVGWHHFRTDDGQAPGWETRAMVERLSEICSTLREEGTPYDARRRIKELEDQAGEESGRWEEFVRVRNLAQAYLRTGQNQSVLKLLVQLPEMIEKETIFPPNSAQQLRRLRAMAHLRLAIESRCLAPKTDDACIFPPREGDTRSNDTAALAAAGFRALGHGRYGTPMDGWLAGVAGMLGGGAGFPAEYVEASVSPRRVMPPFVNTAHAAGVNTLGRAGGAVAADLNGDGWADIVASSWGADDQIRLFLNDHHGSFSDHTLDSGLGGITGGLNLVHADYDNDGDNDLLVLRGAWLGRQGGVPNSLLQNDGRGRFKDVTAGAGLLEYFPTQTAAWCDLDSDGWLDLVMGAESTPTNPFDSPIYLSNGDGTFRKLRGSGARVSAFVKAVSCGDINNDGNMDLHYSVLGGPNQLFSNLGKSPTLKFREVTQEAGVAAPVNSFPSWFWDFDNDGDLDLFAGAYPPLRGSIHGEAFLASWQGQAHDEEPSKWYVNDGSGQFHALEGGAALERVYYPMGANFADLTGNGYPDIYLGTGVPSLEALFPNVLLVNERGDFEDQTAGSATGLLHKGHGVAMADFDHDGDLDIFTVMGGALLGDIARNALLQNHHNHATWLGLQFVGRGAVNRSAIGTRVRVHQGPESDPIENRVNSGGSFGSSELTRIIPLQDQTTGVSLEVWWPGSTVAQSVTDLSTNRLYRIEPGRAPILVRH